MADFGDVDPDAGRTSARTQFSGTVDPLAPSVANGGISLAEWQAYQAKRKKDALLGYLKIFAATTGLGALGQLTTGAGAAAGSLGAIPGGAPWAVTPYVGTASMAPTGAAAVGGTVGGAMSQLAGGGVAKKFLGMSPKDLLALAAGTAGTVGGALAKKPDLAPNTATTDPQLQELLALMSGRLKKSEPLFDSVQAMANGLLPTQYQKGGGGMG